MVPGGMMGHLLAWERHERDGSWWAWVSWTHQTSAALITRLSWSGPASLRPLEPPQAYKAVPRRLRGSGGQIWGSGLAASGSTRPVQCRISSPLAAATSVSSALTICTFKAVTWDGLQVRRLGPWH
jgi:hypothetical protein